MSSPQLSARPPRARQAAAYASRLAGSSLVVQERICELFVPCLRRSSDSNLERQYWELWDEGGERAIRCGILVLRCGARRSFVLRDHVFAGG